MQKSTCEKLRQAFVFFGGTAVVRQWKAGRDEHLLIFYASANRSKAANGVLTCATNANMQISDAQCEITRKFQMKMSLDY